MGVEGLNPLEVPRTTELRKVIECVEGVGCVR